MSATGRTFLKAAAAGGGIAISSTLPHIALAVESDDKKRATANEDLMQVHAVMRRALLVYGLAAPRLQRNPASVSARALAKTASLFREFGEDYHERRIEERWIFPAVRKLKGPASRYPDILQQ